MANGNCVVEHLFFVVVFLSIKINSPCVPMCSIERAIRCELYKWKPNSLRASINAERPKSRKKIAEEIIFFQGEAKIVILCVRSAPGDANIYCQIKYSPYFYREYTQNSFFLYMGSCSPFYLRCFYFKLDLYIYMHAHNSLTCRPIILLLHWQTNCFFKKRRPN